MISLDVTLFVQMAIFLAFTLFINALLLQPMARHLERRKRTLADLRETGSEQDSTLEKLQRDYSQKLGAAREDMLSQRSSARKEAMDIQSSLIDEAKKEANKELYTAESELKKEIVAAKTTLEKDVHSLASTITEKILGRSVQ